LLKDPEKEKINRHNEFSNVFNLEGFGNNDKFCDGRGCGGT